MLNLELLTELALSRHAPSPRVAVGRTLVAFGAFAVLIGSVLDDESERKPEIIVT
jgi:hypothetical protein